MIEDPENLIALLSRMQAVLGLGLGLLFAWHYRNDRRPHLRYWAASFLALSVFLACSGAAMLLARSGQPALSLRTLFSLLSQLAAYVHVATLVLGTLSLRAGVEPPPFLARGVIAAAFVLGIAATLAFAFDPAAAMARIYMRVGLRNLVAAAAYLGVAFALLHGQARQQAPIGQRIVAVALLCMGLCALGNFAVVGLSVPLERAVSGPWLSLFEFAAVAAVGAGLLVWMQGDDRARAEGAAHEVERLTFFDPRTGLPNRRLFVDRLIERLIAADVRNEQVALMIVRPDRVRALRAALGDPAIDSLIARLAVRIGEAAGTGALLGRLDDDRLALTLAPVASADEVERRAENLLANLTLALPGPGGAEVPVTCAIGYSVFPDDGGQAEELVTAATAAQAGAAADGGSRVAPFNRKLGERNRAELALAGELRHALAAGELELFYQPIFDIAQRLVGAEALLRWRHPRRGLLLPAQFLPAAEHGGMLPEIDRLVLSRACQRITRWRRAGGRDLRLSVNVAAQTFELARFPEFVDECLSASGAAPRLLELEITEATAMRDLHKAARTIDRLRALGVGLSLDDFGVGYSSLSQLRHLAASTLKIDQGFTAGVESDRRDAAIAAALIRLGHSLDMQVVAEGIESPGQLAFYRAEGIDLLQGFLLGKPLPEQEFDALQDAPAAGSAA
jgi:EAL domain-containing protein (putative c-di-GMP-specific phosphodiesterase class I)/GGDEF domain-containing protein